MKKGLFVLSQSDWSLHRKGEIDQERHEERIKEAIRENVQDLISEEHIILNKGQGKVKIPIRSLEQYRFRYNHGKQEHVGQGDGSSKVGDEIAKGSPSKGDSTETGAGDTPGEDYVEAEISIADLEEVLFKELELPDLERDKKKNVIDHTEYEYTDIRKKGIMGNIDKKKTILASMKRQLRESSHTKELTIHEDDLRFKTWQEKTKPSTNAVIIAMMDTSGSMGNWEKYMSRSFFFWAVRFLRTKYKNVDIRFIAHHTEAKEVDEEHFFNKGESGGTICSSVYRKALEIIQQDYPSEYYNIYAFHFSDGDNLTSDNSKCLKLIEEIHKRVNMFGYGEVNQYNKSSTLMRAYHEIEDKKFRYCIMKQKADILKGLKTFFNRDYEKGDYIVKE